MDLYRSIDDLIISYHSKIPKNLDAVALEETIQVVYDHLKLVEIQYDDASLRDYLTQYLTVDSVEDTVEPVEDTVDPVEDISDPVEDISDPVEDISDPVFTNDGIFSSREMITLEKEQGISGVDRGLLFIERGSAQKTGLPPPRDLIKTQMLSLPEIDQTLAQQKLDSLRRIPQYPQKSREWLNQRTNHITASTVAAALGLQGPVARRNLIINKISNGRLCGFTGSEATHWGERYEPVANMLYEFRRGCHLHEFGMIPHPQYPFLGASTDGITDRLTNLEIKCPISREIGKTIPKHYWCQVQLQLEILDLQQSDFLECLFTEIDQNTFYENFYYVDHVHFRHLEKGIQLETWDPTQQKLVYLYSPIRHHMNHLDMKSWEEQTLNSLSEQGLIYLNTIYWILKTYSCTLIYRNRSWFQSVLPLLQSFWNEVNRYRELGLDRYLADQNLALDGARVVSRQSIPTKGVCLL